MNIFWMTLVVFQFLRLAYIYVMVYLNYVLSF